jgi:hypothetical protein
MDFGKFHFGRIEIDGVTYERDVVIDRARIRKRKKKASKRFRQEFGHTPVSVEEEIPWNCQRLVVGTGRHGSYRDICQPTQENKCHSPCDVLIDPRCVARASLTTLSMSAEPPETRISPRRHVTLDARGH